MVMPGRKYAAGGGLYRYGFNGKENDNEVKGEGNQQDYGMRIYDPRLGRFLSVDPLTKTYPMLTPFQFCSNRPIDGIDVDGKEWAQSTTEVKLSETQIKRVTQFYVKLKVINESKIVTDANEISVYAEAYKSSVESKFKGTGTYSENGIIIEHEFSTTVILDYSQEPEPEKHVVKNPDGTEKVITFGAKYAKLIFDDRISRENGLQENGDTKGFINSFQIRVGVTMNGNKTEIEEFKKTAVHENGHSGKLNHPWELSTEEAILMPELNQLNPETRKKTTILNNFMNSAENDNETFRSDTGVELLYVQLKHIFNNVSKIARYTPEQLKTPDPEKERNK
jgi:RHS repeat-associated protein